MASIKDCRLDPEPETRTWIRLPEVLRRGCFSSNGVAGVGLDACTSEAGVGDEKGADLASAVALFRTGPLALARVREVRTWSVLEVVSAALAALVATIASSDWALFFAKRAKGLALPPIPGSRTGSARGSATSSAFLGEEDCHGLEPISLVGERPARPGRALPYLVGDQAEPPFRPSKLFRTGDALV